MTGPITVEDVVYENVNGEDAGVTPSKDLTFRRLTFERSVGLVQSEALVTRESPGQTEKRKSNSAKSRKKGNQISSGNYLLCFLRSVFLFRIKCYLH